MAEFLNDLLFAHPTIKRRTRFVLLIIAIDDDDRRILVFLECRLLAFLGIQRPDNVEILDGIGDAPYRQHGLSFSTNLLIYQTHKTMHNEFCNLVHTWLKRIDPVFTKDDVYIIFVTIFQLFWQLKVNGHSVWYNGLCGVKDITILNGFAHGITVERNPHRLGQCAAELTEPCQRFITWSGSETYQ